MEPRSSVRSALGVLLCVFLGAALASKPVCRATAAVGDLTLERSDVSLDWTCLEGSLESLNSTFFKIHVNAKSMNGLALQFLAYNRDGGHSKAYQKPTGAAYQLFKVFGPASGTATMPASSNVRYAEWGDAGTRVFLAAGLELADVCQGSYLVEVAQPVTPLNDTVNYGLLVRLVEGHRDGSSVSYPTGPALGRSFTAEEVVGQPFQLRSTGGDTSMAQRRAFATRSTMVPGDTVSIPVGEDWALRRRMLANLHWRLEAAAPGVSEDNLGLGSVVTWGKYDMAPNSWDSAHPNVFLMNGTASKQEALDLPMSFVERATAMVSNSDASDRTTVSLTAPNYYSIANSNEVVLGLPTAGVFADLRLLLLGWEDLRTLDLSGGGTTRLDGVVVRSDADPDAPTYNPEAQYIFAVRLPPIYWSNFTVRAVAAREVLPSGAESPITTKVATFGQQRAISSNSMTLTSGSSFPDSLTSSLVNPAWWNLPSSRGLYTAKDLWLADPTELGPSTAETRYLVWVTLDEGCGQRGTAWPKLNGSAVTHASLDLEVSVDVLPGDCTRHSQCMVKRQHPGKDRKQYSANKDVSRLDKCRLRSEPLAGAVHLQPVARCVECYVNADCKEGQYCQSADNGLCRSPDSRWYVCDEEAFNWYGMCREKKDDHALGLRCRGSSAPSVTNPSSINVYTSTPTALFQDGAELKEWANGNGFCGGLRFWNATADGTADITSALALGGAVRAVHWTGACTYGICQECDRNGDNRWCRNGKLLDRLYVEGTVRTLGHDSKAQALIMAAFASWCLLFLVPAYFICESNRHREEVSGGALGNESCWQVGCGLLCCLPTCHNTCGGMCGVHGGRAGVSGGSDDKSAQVTTNPLSGGLPQAMDTTSPGAVIAPPSP